MTDKGLHWFRRDLRLSDNVALAAALAGNDVVYCVFCFDTEILGRLSSRADRRVEFICLSVAELDRALQARGGGLLVLHGRATDEIPKLAKALQVARVYANRDYEPAAIVRDRQVERSLSDSGIAFQRCKDQVIFEMDELLTKEGRPYTVYTAYRNAWLKRLPETDITRHSIDGKRGCLAPASRAVPQRGGATEANGKPAGAMPRPDIPGLEVPGLGIQSLGIPTLEELGFQKTSLLDLGFKPGESGAEETFEEFLPRMRSYHEARNYPAVRGVSYLSVHLRFGTIPIRKLVDTVLRARGEGARTWLGELIWRDFYFSILYQFPHVDGHAFRREFEDLRFENDQDQFAAWCEGRTGYPLVDAAMRQINTTGYMHNRLRMVAASFLVKDLHVDWRWGERYFADQLNDFDLAANNGGWQWSASTGNDAQPWFRIFNPVLQSRRFDPEGKFIRRYVPELAGCSDKLIHEPWRMSAAEQKESGVQIGRDYPHAIVDHAKAREKTLRMFDAVRPDHGGSR